MLDVKKYYLYCMGEGYLDKRKYGEDFAFEKGVQRVMQAGQDAEMQTLLRQPRNMTPAQGQAMMMTPLNPFQQAVFAFLRPIQSTVSNVREWLSAFFQRLNPQAQQSLPGQQAPKGNLFERLLAQVFGFFKPKNKDNPEEKDREQRFLQDFNDESVWGRRFVEQSSGAGTGGGQK